MPPEQEATGDPCASYPESETVKTSFWPVYHLHPPRNPSYATSCDAFSPHKSPRKAKLGGACCAFLISLCLTSETWNACAYPFKYYT